MKNALIGGFLSFLGSLWLIEAGKYADAHLANAWTTPPGRFLTTLFAGGSAPFFLLGALLLVLGLIVLWREYFTHEE